MQFDSDDTYTLLLYGACAAVALWLASAIVSSIDTIPVVSTLFMSFMLSLQFLRLGNKVYFLQVWLTDWVLNLMTSVSQVDGSCGSWLYSLVQLSLSDF